MIKTKVAFLEGRLLSSQSEQSKKFLKSPDWLKKAGPPKSHFCFDHVNRLIVLLKLDFYHCNVFPGFNDFNPMPDTAEYRIKSLHYSIYISSSFVLISKLSLRIIVQRKIVVYVIYSLL